MKKLMLAALAVSTVIVSTPAAAAEIIYTGRQNVDGIQADYSITTDGVLGSDAVYLIDFKITLTVGAKIIELTNANAFQSMDARYFATETSLALVEGELGYYSDYIENDGRRDYVFLIL